MHESDWRKQYPQFFVEALGEANEQVADLMSRMAEGSSNEYRNILCADGTKRNLWQVPDVVARAILGVPGERRPGRIVFLRKLSMGAKPARCSEADVRHWAGMSAAKPVRKGAALDPAVQRAHALTEDRPAVTKRGAAGYLGLKHRSRKGR